MNNIKLIIHNRDEKFWDVTDMIGDVQLTDSTASICRTLTTDIPQMLSDDAITQIGLKVGSSCCFYVDDEEIYRGNIIDLENNNGMLNITTKDLGYVLANAKFSKNYTDQTPEQIASEIIKSAKLKVGKLAKTNKKMTRFFRDTSAYDIIMTLYTIVSKDTGKKYELQVGLDDVNVIERGKALDIQFTADTNIYESTFTESIEDLISGVTIVDKNGKLIEEHLNKEYYNIYKRMKNVILEVEDKSKINKALIDKQYKGVTQSCNLSGVGDYHIRAGASVNVTDTQTGLTGIFYIDTVNHTWSNGIYHNELELNFENIMNEVSGGNDKKDEQSTGGSTVGTVDWGHGITTAQLNKLLRGKLSGKGDLLIKFGNMYKVNPALIALMMRMECGAGFNSELAKNFNNFGGITGDPKYPNNGRFVKYPSVDVGIERMFRLLSVKYIHDWGKHSLSSIIHTYAPPSENNTGNYINSIKKWYEDMTGKAWTDTALGNGVASVDDAHKNIVYGGGTGDGQITGSDGHKYKNEKQRILVEEAKKMIGKGRYTYGGRGGIGTTDCSGFVHYLHQKAGINVGWTTSSQKYNGREIPLSEAQAGDIIVMQSKYSPSGRHVVMCAGNGKIIHNGGPQGRPISMTNLYTYGKYTVRRCWE